jgi:molybdate transport system substrate-binding protein
MSNFHLKSFVRSLNPIFSESKERIMIDVTRSQVMSPLTPPNAIYRHAVLSIFACLLLIFPGCGDQKVAAPKSNIESIKNESNQDEKTKTETGIGPAISHHVRIAAAADLKFALEDIIQEYLRTHAGSKVEATYGASGTLFTQLTHAAPFDLYLSADLEYPRKLAEQGHADGSTEFKYAVGHIVVWVPKRSELDVEQLGIKAVTDERVKKVAIANPLHAPYGRAAEAALKSLGVYDQVKGHLVLGENIAQTAQFIESGAADVGIISLSLALSPAMRDKGRFWKVPGDTFPKLEQGGVITKQCQDVASTQELKKYLTGPEGGTILKKYGFVVPGD